MILVLYIELVEVAAPPPYPHDEIFMILGVLLRVEQAIAVDRVQLQLMPAALHEQLDEPRDFLRSLIVAEEGVVENSRVRGPPLQILSK